MAKGTNVLILQCDQLNASVLSCYGGPVKAKHLERLCSKSIRFTAAYCPTPVCSPSRASFITGLYPHRHGITSNVMRMDYPICGGPATEEGITAADTTTEKILFQKGYRTGHYGKWHLSGEDLPYYPDMYREHYEYEADCAAPFKQAMELPAEQRMDWYNWQLPVQVDEKLKAAAKNIKEPWKSLPRLHDFYSKIGRLDMDEKDTFDYRVAQKGIDFLKRNKPGTPFMLTCSFNWPHDPNVIVSPYYEMVDPADIDCSIDLPCDPLFMAELSKEIPQQAGPDFLREFLRVYYASVLFIDAQVGRVLQALDESGERDNTLVLFCADHGDMAGGHGMFWKSTSAFYEEVARVPLLLSYPPLGQGDFSGLANLVDIMPTILELTGAECPPDLDGESLVPYMGGQAAGRAAVRDAGERATLSERLDWAPGNRRAVHSKDAKERFMLRYKDYKYCYYTGGKEILYDLEKDPSEYDNKANAPEYAETLRSMREKLRAHLAKSGYAL